MKDKERIEGMKDMIRHTIRDLMEDNDIESDSLENQLTFCIGELFDSEIEKLERQLDKQLKKVAKLESELDTLNKKLESIKKLPQTIQIQEIQHITPMELNVDKETVAAMLETFSAFKRNKVRIIIEPIGE